MEQLREKKNMVNREQVETNDVFKVKLKRKETT